MRNALILFLLFVIKFWVGYYVGSMNRREIIVHETVYVPFDTIRIVTQVPFVVKEETIKPIPVQYWRIDTVTLEAKVDTAKIIADFFVRKFYDQVFVEDSTGYIRLKQIVEMNAITEQELIFLPAPKQITYITISAVQPEKKLRFSAGGQLLLSDKNDFMIQGGVLLNNRFHVNLGYGINNTKGLGLNIFF